MSTKRHTISLTKRLHNLKNWTLGGIAATVLATPLYIAAYYITHPKNHDTTENPHYGESEIIPPKAVVVEDLDDKIVKAEKNQSPILVKPKRKVTTQTKELNQTTKHTHPYYQLDYNNPTLQGYIRKDVFEPGFLQTFERYCKRDGVHAMTALGILDMESYNYKKGIRFDNTYQNPVSKTTGLFQLGPSAAKDLGTTVDKIKKMSQTQQLELGFRYLGYVKKRDPVKYNFSKPYALAGAIFCPASKGNPEYIVGDEEGTKLKRLAYTNNKSLDINKDGEIRLKEYAGRLFKSPLITQ